MGVQTATPLLQHTPKNSEMEDCSSANGWIDSEVLASGFREYNLGLDVPRNYQDTLDEILDYENKQISLALADHQRRVGGYSGVLLPIMFPEYDDAFHLGLIRVAGAVHDIGKQKIDLGVMFRSIGAEGHGKFDRNRDMPEMRKHTLYGYELIRRMQNSLPPEAAYVAGCHHQFPDTGMQPYGMDLSEISGDFANNPEMERWTRSAVEVVSLADYFDASSRANGYFSSNESRNSSLFRYVQQRQPDKFIEILGALEHEKTFYQLQLGQVALVA